MVSGSFQAFDQGYLKEALARLGRGFVGVTQLPPTVTDAELRRLDRAGVDRIVPRGIQRRHDGGRAAEFDLAEMLGIIGLQQDDFVAIVDQVQAQQLGALASHLDKP